MSHELRRRWPSWAIVLVLTALHWLGFLVILIQAVREGMIYGKTSGVVTALLWLFGFPIMLTQPSKLFGIDPLYFTFPNSLLYGLMWYSAWRMLRWMFRAGAQREG